MKKKTKIIFIAVWLFVCALLGIYLPKIPLIKELIEIKVVKVKGTERFKKEDVAKYFANHNWFFVNEEEIEKAMKKEFPFIKNIEIQRLFVGEIRLVVLEREPFAVLKHKGKKYIIDDEGVVLDYYKIDEKNLPEIVAHKSINPALISSVMKIYTDVNPKFKIKRFSLEGKRIICITDDDKIFVFTEETYKEGLEKFKIFTKKVDITPYKYLDFSFDSMVVSRR